MKRNTIVYRLSILVSLSWWALFTLSANVSPRDGSPVAHAGKQYSLRIDMQGSCQGQAIIMFDTSQGKLKDTVNYSGASLIYQHMGIDTLRGSVLLLDPILAAQTAAGTNHYPEFTLIIVPGEEARISATVSRDRIPEINWVAGGPVSRDFVLLNHEMNTPAEKAFQQIILDHTITEKAGRDYTPEYRASYTGQREKTKDFIKCNPASFITVMELAENFSLYAENYVESVYNSFPAEVKYSKYGNMVRAQLDRNPDARCGMPAPDFRKKDMNGESVALSSLRGKYVLLDFWGSWCMPCRDSHPHLAELHSMYGELVEFISIAQENGKDMEKSRNKWLDAVAEDGMTWTQILNNEGQNDYDIVRDYHIGAYPTKILIDPAGNIAGRYIGIHFDVKESLEEKLAGIAQ